MAHESSPATARSLIPARLIGGRVRARSRLPGTRCLRLNTRRRRRSHSPVRVHRQARDDQLVYSTEARRARFGPHAVGRNHGRVTFQSNPRRAIPAEPIIPPTRGRMRSFRRIHHRRDDRVYSAIKTPMRAAGHRPKRQPDRSRLDDRLNFGPVRTDTPEVRCIAATGHRQIEPFSRAGTTDD